MILSHFLSQFFIVKCFSKSLLVRKKRQNLLAFKSKLIPANDKIGILWQGKYRTDALPLHDVRHFENSSPTERVSAQNKIRLASQKKDARLMVGNKSSTLCKRKKP